MGRKGGKGYSIVFVCDLYDFLRFWIELFRFFCSYRFMFGSEKWYYLGIVIFCVGVF